MNKLTTKEVLIKHLEIILVMAFIFLFLTWCTEGLAGVNPYPKIDESCWNVQQACDDALTAADEVIMLQMKAYGELKKDNERLEQDLYKLKRENFNLNNPPWYNDPMWTGLAGMIGGIFVVLSLQK